MQLFTCLVVSVVAMVTAAPIANEESLIKTVGSDSLDRAKRAEERVYFGNQQNKPRPPTKKSDPSLALEIPTPDVVPQSEADEGGMIVAHDETPISDDLESRIEAAQEGGNQKAEMDDAMESAMHAAVSSVVGEPEAETADDNHDSGETVGNESTEEAPPTGDDGDNENNDEGDVGDQSSESETNEADDVEKELQEATASESESEDDDGIENAAASNAETVPGPSEELAPETASNEGQNDEVQDFLNELEEQDGSENNFDSPAEVSQNVNDYYKNMYQYMVPSRYPEEQDSYPSYPYLPIYYRRRRSSPRFRRNHQLSFGSHRGRTRRIKRDLFDDLALSDLAERYQDNPDNYLPLSDEELEYLYAKLLPYLAEAYAEASDDVDNNGYDAVDSLRPYPVLEELEPEEEEVYEPQIPVYAERPYQELALNAPVQNEYPFEKRGITDYYAAAPPKRYFFPFSDEPETHWGAFVPEKRNYDEAIHRLRRLAMELSDEPGPYYSELLGEYRKK